MSAMCGNVTKCQFPSRNAAILYGLSPFSEILYGLSQFSYVPGSPPRGQPSSRSATHHSIRKASGPAPGTGCNATFKQLTTRRMGPRPVPSAVSFLDPVLEKRVCGRNSIWPPSFLKENLRNWSHKSFPKNAKCSIPRRIRHLACKSHPKNCRNS